MQGRGRSRDISPIALARTAANDHLVRAQLALADAPESNPFSAKQQQHESARYATSRRRTMCQQSEPLSCVLPPQPLASSSRAVPSPPFSHSHSSTASTSPEPTPAPATPPELAEGAFPIRRHRAQPVEYWESPPSPPRTLQDQLHVAYAHENFHLAKILLLRLRGIEVIGDNDPRIDEVTDEDFASTFVPRGKFKLDEEAQRRCLEGQRRERERLRRRAREERLRACERLWEKSLRCLREDKARVARRKEDECRIRRRAEIEAREREREAREREKERELLRYPRNLRPNRAVLSYGDLPAATSRTQMSTSRSPPKAREEGPSFEYALMPPVPTSSLSPTKSRKSQGSPNRAFRELAALSAANVAFQDVLRSMHGPLFAVDDVAERPRLKRTSAQLDLLDTLLNTSPWDARVSESAGSSRIAVPKPAVGLDDKCLARTATVSTVMSDPSVSSSLSMLSRSMSWFSFGSSRTSSKQSISTAITTPSTSPSVPSKVFLTFLPSSPTETLISSTPSGKQQQHCRHLYTPRSQYIPVTPSEDPLYIAPPPRRVPPHSSTDTLRITRGRQLTRQHISIVAGSGDIATLNSGGLVKRISRSVSSFLDAAAQLHRAYVKATMYNAGPDLYFPEYSSASTTSRSRSSSRSRTRSRTITSAKGVPLRPQGYRATSEDVITFTSTLSSTSPDGTQHESVPQRSFIPLVYTPSASAALPEIPRVFPEPPPIPRSPFRLPYPPPTLTSRLRPVANPLLLRLRALENLYGQVIEMRIRDKVVGVAWEGIGRSKLIREIKPAGWASGARYPRIQIQDVSA